MLTSCAQLFGLEDPDRVPPDAPQCTTDETCGAHEYCSAAGTCECVAGYARTPNTCTWAGVVTAPGFDDANAWTATDATLEPAYTENGIVDAGRATFTSANGCAGTIEQRFAMPRLSRAEPLVAEIHYRSDQTQFVGVAFKVMSGWVEDLDRGYAMGWQKRRVCLGAAHYAPESSTGAGVDQTLILPRAVTSGVCTWGYEIDRFDIVPAMPDECPAPGTVLNGDASGTGGWTFRTTAGATAGFVDNGGESDSRAARLVAPSMCDFSGLTVSASPELADGTGSPRFSFFTRHELSMRVATRLESKRGFWVSGGGMMTLTKSCVPAPLRGIAWPLSIDYEAGLNTGNCGTAFGGAVTVDSFALGNDPDCGTDPLIADPGFDSDYPPASYQATPGGFVRKLYDPTKVHSGRGVLEMGVTSCQPAPSLRIHVVTPDKGTTGGPAFRFWYRVAQLDGQTNFRVSSPGQSIALTASMGSMWTHGLLCLDPRKLPGRAQEITFQMTPFNCNGTLGDSVFLDELSVEYDASCPN